MAAINPDGTARRSEWCEHGRFAQGDDQRHFVLKCERSERPKQVRRLAHSL